jgi:hypothetical protein
MENGGVKKTNPFVNMQKQAKIRHSFDRNKDSNMPNINKHLLRA